MLSGKAPLGGRVALAAAGALSGAALALAAGGCGGETDDTPSSSETSLTVTLDIDGPAGAGPRTASVSCPGSGACAAAELLSPSDLAPVPAGRACTQIAGGPEVATVEGELDGEQVSATFNRANGCEIDRFAAIVSLLQAVFPDYRPGSSLEP